MLNMSKFCQCILIFLCLSLSSMAQIRIAGEVRDKFLKEKLPGIVLTVEETHSYSIADTSGIYHLTLPQKGKYTFLISGFPYQSISQVIDIQLDTLIDFELEPSVMQLQEHQVKGESRWIQKNNSALVVEQISGKLLNKNPNSSIFEALSNINGISPQISCAVCNSSELSMNGLAGAYTMILIDGMPLISPLARTYGLNSIPLGIVDKIELTKGVASVEYGTEAMGGLINIITKSPTETSPITFQLFKTTLNENNLDISFAVNRKKIQTIMGVNVWMATTPMDINKDNFTDFALAKRVSVFNKWRYVMPNQTRMEILMRAYYEDRWGGELNWNKQFWGGDERYGEGIVTKRIEFLTNTNPFLNEKIHLKFAYFGHEQHSAYGTFRFQAKQQTLFGQIGYDEKIGKNDLSVGLPLRYNIYDDNSTLTTNKAEKILVPAFFVKGNWHFNKQLNSQTGLRFDFHPIHGFIFSPQLAFKANTLDDKTSIRMGIGKGFRIVNLFTEEHAAISGAREISIPVPLRPEKSWNLFWNIDRTFYFNQGYFDNNLNVFYTYFSNRILPDYTSNPNQIIFNNLKGYSIARGFSYDGTLYFKNGLTLMSGITFKDVFSVQNKQKELVLLTDKFSGVWTISYKIFKKKLEIDYTGNIRGGMKLPLLNVHDPRPQFSKPYSIQNLKFSWRMFNSVECFVGIKNILNFNPSRGIPFMIARANDPFDKNVRWDTAGFPLITPENPYGLTFDPSYVYAPLQGRNVYLGFKFQTK